MLEKQRTTPDAYPLTLNALRLACNQATNRDPVVEYGEAEIREALASLGRRRWTRTASSHSSRAAKYRHLLDTELDLSGDQLSLLCVLMLRGPQTPGELKQRSERLHRFDGLADLLATLDALIEHGLVARLPRRPGQKEERFRQLLGGSSEPASAHATPEPADAPAAATGEERLERLEREVAELRSEVESLRESLGG